MEILDCSNTTLRELNLTDFYRLTELHCRGLHLQSLNVNVLPELQLLDCGENELTSLYLSNLQLEKLICDNNQLTTLDLSRCTALKEVDCRKKSADRLHVGNGFTAGAELCGKSAEFSEHQQSAGSGRTGLQRQPAGLADADQSASAGYAFYAGSNPLLALNLSEQAPMTVCDLQNCVVLKKPSCNRKDLYLEPTQWSGFRLDLVQTWNNAECSGTKVYITDPLQNITYTYNTGNPNVTASFTVQLQDIPMNIVDVTLENEKNIFYTGEPLTPDVIVVAGGNELKQGTDYTLSYENNLNAGRGTILVSGAEDSLVRQRIAGICH